MTALSAMRYECAGNWGSFSRIYGIHFLFASEAISAGFGLEGGIVIAELEE